MNNIKNDYGLDMSKLVNQLRVKAGVMEMGERIAWGSDTALMREAADRIEALEDAIKETIEENLDLADGENCTLIKLKRSISYDDLQPLTDEEIAFQRWCD